MGLNEIEALLFAIIQNALISGCFGFFTNAARAFLFRFISHGSSMVNESGKVAVGS